VPDSCPGSQQLQRRHKLRIHASVSGGLLSSTRALLGAGILSDTKSYAGTCLQVKCFVFTCILIRKKFGYLCIAFQHETCPSYDSRKGLETLKKKSLKYEKLNYNIWCWTGMRLNLSLLFILSSNLSIYIKIDVCLCMCVCVCVCMFGHNSGTPGAISTKLGTHTVVCMRKNLMYILYIYYLLSIIFSREDGVGGLHAIHHPRDYQSLPR
jgi:hypothetical protein